jgi:hypothetical protein
MTKAILEVDTIEAMRKHIEALQQENEQLQAQVARAREALIDYKTFFRIISMHM